MSVIKEMKILADDVVKRDVILSFCGELTMENVSVRVKKRYKFAYFKKNIYICAPNNHLQTIHENNEIKFLEMVDAFGFNCVPVSGKLR